MKEWRPQAMPTLYINGKFTAQRLTGVQRYAHQIVQALDQESAALGPRRAVLLCPPGAPLPALRHVQARHTDGPGLPLHLWEQAMLPLAARGGLLLNLAGSAPLFSRGQWCTFHDAAVFDHPQAYTRRFVAWYRFHFRWLARRAEQLLTVSLHSRQRLALHLGVLPDQVAVVPDGGDHLLALRPEPAITERLGLQGCRWLLAVGSLNPNKNIAALLQAWAGLALPPDLRLVLVGDADPAVFAGGAGSAQRRRPAGVVAAGRVSDAELKALYGGALALVFPSLDEGFGLPPLEAMSLGCPVAVSASGAMPEVCGDAALYFDPRDEGSIRAALQRLLAEPDLRADLSRRGLAHAAGWTWRRSAQALIRLLAAAGGPAR